MHVDVNANLNRRDYNKQYLFVFRAIKVIGVFELNKAICRTTSTSSLLYQTRMTVSCTPNTIQHNTSTRLLGNYATT